MFSIDINFATTDGYQGSHFCRLSDFTGKADLYAKLVAELATLGYRHIKAISAVVTDQCDKAKCFRWN